jgi:hypothetical protein
LLSLLAVSVAAPSRSEAQELWQAAAEHWFDIEVVVADCRRTLTMSATWPLKKHWLMPDKHPIAIVAEEQPPISVYPALALIWFGA